MKTAVGSCVLTSVTLEHIDALRLIFTFLTPDGWKAPEWLQSLDDAIVNQPKEESRNRLAGFVGSLPNCGH